LVEAVKEYPTTNNDLEIKNNKVANVKVLNSDEILLSEIDEEVPNIWQELVIFGFALFLHSFIDGLTVGLFKEIE
jgi:hypothetical protein